MLIFLLFVKNKCLSTAYPVLPQLFGWLAWTGIVAKVIVTQTLPVCLCALTMDEQNL